MRTKQVSIEERRRNWRFFALDFLKMLRSDGYSKVTIVETLKSSARIHAATDRVAAEMYEQVAREVEGGLI